MIVRVSLRDARWLWVALLAVHAPAVARAWCTLISGHATAGQMEGCAWLTLSTLFFILKLVRIPWLEFRADRRSALALAVAILLLHAGPLGLRRPDSPAAEMPAATLILVITLDSVQRQLARVLRTSAGRPGPHFLPLSYACSFMPPLRERSTVLCRHAPRPPPNRPT
jgi:hypothetical protein